MINRTYIHNKVIGTEAEPVNMTAVLDEALTGVTGVEFGTAEEADRKSVV